jgi:chemotaxis family two-component system response regulator Rcp1
MRNTIAIGTKFMAMELRNNHAWFGAASWYRDQCERNGETEMRIRPIRVLLVEDNPADQLLAREIIFAAYPDSRITVIDDGEKAIFAVEHWSASDLPDIVFLDLNLPRINGHEVLDLINKNALRVPVIVLTGSTSEKDIERARRHNILDYIIKPIGMKELEETISRVKSLIEPICG